MNVTREIIDRFISDPFLDPSDDTLIDNALTVMREQGLDLVALGLDREELRRRIVAARATAGPQQPMRLPVQPQARSRPPRRATASPRGCALPRDHEAAGVTTIPLRKRDRMYEALNVQDLEAAAQKGVAVQVRFLRVY